MLVGALSADLGLAIEIVCGRMIVDVADYLSHGSRRA